MPSGDAHDTVWDLKPHTAAKHEILRHYLEAWFPILGSWQGQVVFSTGSPVPAATAEVNPAPR